MGGCCGTGEPESIISMFVVNCKVAAMRFILRRKFSDKAVALIASFAVFTAETTASILE